MELIPILSTIILVATISTFILAIGAYILYKVREKKGEKKILSQPSTVEGELITPAFNRQHEYESKIKREPVYDEQQVIDRTYRDVKQPVYFRYGKPGPSSKYFKERRERTAEEKLKKDSRFLKYTSEGYVQPTQDESSSKLKWR